MAITATAAKAIRTRFIRSLGQAYAPAAVRQVVETGLGQLRLCLTLPAAATRICHEIFLKSSFALGLLAALSRLLS